MHYLFFLLCGGSLAGIKIHSIHFMYECASMQLRTSNVQVERRRRGASGKDELKYNSKWAQYEIAQMKCLSLRHLPSAISNLYWNNRWMNINPILLFIISHHFAVNCHKFIFAAYPLLKSEPNGTKYAMNDLVIISALSHRFHIQRFQRSPFCYILCVVTNFNWILSSPFCPVDTFIEWWSAGWSR